MSNSVVATAKEMAASLPPVGVTTFYLLDMPVERWVAVLTLLWLSLQIGHFVYTKLIRPHYRKRKQP